MPEITFDGRRVRVPDATNLVEAGREAGVPVPVFCYHRSLGAVGACRVCAVTVTEKGKARLAMACMTDAADGMTVTTLDAHSVEFRRFVLEWLMENHPHDCPICDEGGECQLQDLTIATGQDHRRYRARKRTWENQDLGEFIAHEMNRCITCYRCSRFYQEVAGGRDFGSMASRDRVYFGRFESGPLESPFSGNLVEFCPTGVLTDRVFRYRARVWDLEQAASICPHCSVGCNVLPGSRHRELLRVRVRTNPAVNDVFLCDRGQFGHGWSEHPTRPRQIRVRGSAVRRDEALTLAATELLTIAASGHGDTIALVASPRAPLEAHVALRALARGPLAGARLAHFDDPDREARAILQLETLAAAGRAPLDQADLADRDTLLVAGPILVDEAPLAALGVRAAARRGAHVDVWNPGEPFLGDVARLRAVAPGALAAQLDGLARGEAADDRQRATKDALRNARTPAILSGGDLVDPAAIAAAGRLAAGLGEDTRLGFVFPGPNGFGAAALARGGPGIGAVLEAARRRALRAAVIVECDFDDLDPEARDALARIELLVVLDHAAGPFTDAATVLLPADTPYESAGSYVNRAGRVQAFIPSDVPGEPVSHLIDHGSFPRQPRLVPPRGDARPSWWMLEQIREQAGGGLPRDVTGLRAALAREPGWEGLATLAPGGPGLVLDPRALAPGAILAPPPPATPPPGEDGTLALWRCDRTLGSESLSRRSEPMRKMAGPPVARLATADARRLAIGSTVALEWRGETIEVAVRADEAVAEGVLLLPRDARWNSPPPPAARVRVRAPVAVTNGDRP